MAVKAEKPIYTFINPETIHDDVIQAVKDIIMSMGYDITDPKQRRSITHNEINYTLRQVYERLFKPDKALYNNQKSLLNYDDLKTLELLANTFVDVCSLFNKSLGLMSFGYMVGVSHTTLYAWAKDQESNPARSDIIKYIQECHKVAQISLLNDTPVGALAVANNDKETGLNWAANQAQQIGATAVYILPSERADRLKLGKDQELQEITAPEV